MIRGHLDQVSIFGIAGWAQDPARPETPISLLVTHNDTLIARVRANRFRADLKHARIGGGCHGFEVVFAKCLSPFEYHALRVQRELDGEDVPGSPTVLRPSTGFNDTTRQGLDDLIEDLSSEQLISDALDFLVGALDKLLRQVASVQSGRARRAEYRAFFLRWHRHLSEATSTTQVVGEVRPFLRALVLDDRVPKLDCDEFNAIVSHMQSLQRLGYQVTFVPSIEIDGPDLDDSPLKRVGVACCRAPFYVSVEEVVRRQAGEFDLVYLYRLSNAAKYGALIRQYLPKARVICNIPDLHHIHLSRWVPTENRQHITTYDDHVARTEFAAVLSADAVITYAYYDASILRDQVPGAVVHTLPWPVPIRPTVIPFHRRHDFVYIGGDDIGDHDLEAAHRLVHEVLPLVRERNPTIRLLLVGNAFSRNMPDLSGDGVVLIGDVEELTTIFDRVRVTVAPLGCGTDLNSKVVESLAAGVPCVCTPSAAEGLELPGCLREYIVEEFEAMARRIHHLHNDEIANEECRRAGLEFIAARFSNERIDTLMRAVIGRI